MSIVKSLPLAKIAATHPEASVLVNWGEEIEPQRDPDREERICRRKPGSIRRAWSEEGLMAYGCLCRQRFKFRSLPFEDKITMTQAV